MKVLSQRNVGWLSIPFLCFLLLIYLAIERIASVTALQNSLRRNWENTFNANEDPRLLPSFIDRAAWRSCQYFWGSTDGSTNKDCVYWERFQSLFRGSIYNIEIYDPQRFLGDTGAALARFPSLRKVKIICSDDLETETDWNRLCSRLRNVHELEELDIEGYRITDGAITPLSGHPLLRTVTISGHLTADCARTFGTLPRLSHLKIMSGWASVGLSKKDQTTVEKTLPKVNVEFLQD